MVILIQYLAGPSKPLPYKHRLTAFFVKDSGVDVECWDIDTLLPSSDRQKTQQDNSKETPPATQDDDGNVSGAGLYIGAGTGVYALAWTDSVDLRSAPSYVILIFYIYFTGLKSQVDFVAPLQGRMIGSLTHLFLVFTQSTAA